MTDGRNWSAATVAPQAIRVDTCSTIARPDHRAVDLPQLDIPDLEILSPLGRGGMARVFLARERELQRLVAFKIMEPRSGEIDEAFIRRFVREARTAASLSHPNIVPVLQFGATADGRHWLTMPYLRDGSLKDRLKQGPLPVAAAIRITRCLASALTAAHARNIVHRDIKPDNVLFNGDVPCLADFGIAKLLDATTELTRAGTPGTLRYMSPEQVRDEAIDQRSDLYALGVMLFEMLTGRLPTGGDTVSAIVYGIANTAPAALPDPLHGLQPLLDRLLTKSPVERLASSRQLEQVLAGVERNLLRGLPLEAVLTDVGLDADPASPSLPSAGAGAAAEPALPAPSMPEELTLTAMDGAAAPTNLQGGGSASPLVSADALIEMARERARKGGRRGRGWLGRLVIAAVLVTALGAVALPYLPQLLRMPLPQLLSLERLPSVTPAPAVGGLSVTTTPPDATVELDGQTIGRSPVSMLGIPTGEHRVRVRLQGFEPMEAHAQVRSNGVAVLDFDLGRSQVAARTRSRGG